MPTLTGWEAVVLAMKAEGVPYVFGLPGDPRHLYDALVAVEPDGGPRPIGVRFETSGRLHGDGLRPGDQPDRRLLRLPGTGDREPGARHPGGVLRLYADARARGALSPPDVRQRRVSGDRPHRHALLDHQVGHDGRAAGEHPLGDAPRRPDRHQRPAGSGLRRASRRHRSGRLGDPGLHAGGAGSASGRRSRRAWRPPSISSPRQSGRS